MFCNFEADLSKRKSNSKNDEASLPISYQQPFAEAIQNFFHNNPAYYKKFRSQIGILNFSISSQTFGSDEKAIIFPITNDKGTVISLWGGLVNKERDYLRFYYLQNSSDAVQNIINAFQNGIRPEIANKEHVIDEIVMYVPQSHLELPDWWFDHSFPGEAPSTKRRWRSRS